MFSVAFWTLDAIIFFFSVQLYIGYKSDLFLLYKVVPRVMNFQALLVRKTTKKTMS